MNVNSSTISTQKNYPPHLTDADEVYYLDTNPTIMPKGINHFLQSFQPISALIAFFAKREDVKKIGNFMLYCEEGNRKKFISPDVMIYLGLKNKKFTPNH